MRLFTQKEDFIHNDDYLHKATESITLKYQLFYYKTLVGNMDKAKKGDFLKIDYIGKVKDTGFIFDLTSEEIAKKEKIYRDGDEYKPAVMVVGGGHVLRGLDSQLEGAEVGKKITVEVKSDDAFGPRDAEKVMLVPQSIFNKQKINPMPGMPVKIGGKDGIVQTVSAGRVRVDFNHPLSGKLLEYDVTVIEKITDKTEQIKSLVKIHLPKANPETLKIEFAGKAAEILLPKDDENTRRFINLVKDILVRDILKYIQGVEEVKFIEILDKSNIRLE